MIRALYSQDIKEVYELCREVYSEYAYPMGSLWSVASFESMLLNGYCLGLFFEEKLISLMLCSVSSETMEIELFLTSTRHQKKGLSTKLFLDFLSKVPENKEVWLEVHEKNVPAISFYKKNGFQVVGKREDYYPGGYGAILMTL